jgi:hypothetical protein
MRPVSRTLARTLSPSIGQRIWPAVSSAMLVDTTLAVPSDS